MLRKVLGSLFYDFWKFIESVLFDMLCSICEKSFFSPTLPSYYCTMSQLSLLCYFFMPSFFPVFASLDTLYVCT